MERARALADARSRFYLYLRQNGLWTREVTGFEPVKDKAKLDPYCPVRNVTPAYPPTLLIHGTVDTDVPYDLSAAMAKEFEKHKVPHELVTVPDSLDENACPCRTLRAARALKRVGRGGT